MAIKIQWVEFPTGKTEVVSVATVAGCLKIYRQQQVIIKTQWVLQADIAKNNDELVSQIQSYINTPDLDIKLNLYRQGTAFRNKTWNEMLNIPVGTVITYGELAEKVGSGARAVANACRVNPFPGLIPCHRVVAANGLGGYMGETTGEFFEIKKKLLQSEANLVMDEPA